MVAAATASFGQTVMSSKFFENIYLGINGGIQAPLETGDTHIHPAAGLELGKDITPVLGFSGDGYLIFKEDGQEDAIQRLNVDLNATVNLSNWIGGYKGAPRRVEVLLVPGIGLGHNYRDLTYTNQDPNYVTFNTFAQFNINLGEKRAWFFNIKPGIVWNSYAGKQTGSIPNGLFRIDASDLRITAGIAYRFGSKRTGSHNFVLCPYSVTKADYDKVVAERDALQSELQKAPKVVEKEVTKEQKVEVPVYLPAGSFISFKIGSVAVSPVEKVKLKQWAENVPAGKAVTIVGSADTSTGSKAINEKLAGKRAEAVKKIMVEECGIAESGISTSIQLDINAETSAASRAAFIDIAK